MDWNKFGKIDIVLASASPSRKLLFDKAEIDCKVIVSGVDETVPPKSTPAETVEILAERKGQAVFGQCSGKMVISADSVIVIDGEICGKPENEEAAEKMLAKLSGRVHEVFTGVCILYKGKKIVFSQSTEVEFYNLSSAEISNYVESGESLGRAGSYGIEGKGMVLIKGIRGDYSNIVGIPIAETFRRASELV